MGRCTLPLCRYIVWSGCTSLRGVVIGYERAKCSGMSNERICIAFVNHSSLVQCTRLDGRMYVAIGACCIVAQRIHIARVTGASRVPQVRVVIHHSGEGYVISRAILDMKGGPCCCMQM